MQSTGCQPKTSHARKCSLTAQISLSAKADGAKDMLEAVELLVEQSPQHKGLDNKRFQGCRSEVPKMCK